MDANGNEKGKPCDINKTCDATKNLKCNASTGMCDLVTDGKHNSPCYTDTDCANKASEFPGLHCNDLKKCDCTEKSGTLSLCEANKVCIPGGPPDTPPLSNKWPTESYPDPTEAQINQFTGKCTDSKWYKDASGNCGPNSLAGHLAISTTPSTSVQCIPSTNWKGITAGVYDNYCLNVS